MYIKHIEFMFDIACVQTLGEVWVCTQAMFDIPQRLCLMLSINKRRFCKLCRVYITACEQIEIDKACTDNTVNSASNIFMLATQIFSKHVASYHLAVFLID